MAVLMTVCLTVVALCRSSAADEIAELSRLVSDFEDWRFREFPEYATSAGIHNFNDQLESFSFDRFKVRKSQVEQFLRRLKEIGSTRLDRKNRTTFKVLKSNLDAFVTGYAWHAYGMLNPFSFLEGIHLEFKYVISKTRFKTKSDFVMYIARLQKLPQQISEQMQLMNHAIRSGITNHVVSVQEVPSQIDDLFNRTLEDLEMYRPFKQLLENMSDISNADKESLRNQVKAVLSSQIVPMFQRLSRFLKDEYIPNCRSSIGVSTFPQGKEYYQACLNWHLSVSMTPDEVHARGLKEVRRLKAEMTKIARRTGFNGTLMEFYDTLKRNTIFFKETTDEILDFYNDIIFKRVKPQLKSLFGDYPDYPVEVKPLTFNGPAGMYSSPTDDGSTPGIFWVNLRNPEKRATFDMPALALHEADPGHHMQITYKLREDLPLFRKRLDYNKYYACPFHFPFFTSFSEGWALYAEDLGLEMKGVYANDYELFGKYASEMFRACRLVVDTGIHAMNWTRDQAIDYMVNHTFFLRSQMTIEVNRYITWPGQACAYKIGQMKILELRRMAERKLGQVFNIAEFHGVVLRMGSVPLFVLEEEVKEWVEEKLSERSNAVHCCSVGILCTIAAWFSVCTMDIKLL